MEEELVVAIGPAPGTAAEPFATGDVSCAKTGVVIRNKTVIRQMFVIHFSLAFRKKSKATQVRAASLRVMSQLVGQMPFDWPVQPY
jgi:hypothetical protein